MEVSILSVGTMGGWVKPRLKEGLLTRVDIESLVTMVLAGRAADTILGNGANTGAASDLDIANTALRGAMLDMGLYGPLASTENTDPRNWHKGVSLWMAINAELTRLHDRASSIISRRQVDIFRLVEVLLVERVVTGERLVEIVGVGSGANEVGDAENASEDRLPAGMI